MGLMPARKSVLSAQASLEAARVRARRELVELDERRFAVEQVKSGCSQDSIAEALGTSQAQISRWLADAASHPRSLSVTVDELLKRRLLGAISAEELVAQLSRVTLTYVNPDKRPHSPWAKLRDAHRRGLLNDEETRQIARHTAERMVGRVNRHMALEAQLVSETAAERSVGEATERLLKTL
jgi:predicted transcriptional regulator